MFKIGDYVKIEYCTATGFKYGTVVKVEGGTVYINSPEMEAYFGNSSGLCFFSHYLTLATLHEIETLSGVSSTKRGNPDPAEEDFWGPSKKFTKEDRRKVLEEESFEELTKPARYNQGKIEVWDFILDQGLGFLEGNIIKYLCRSSLKGGLEDLKKARVYLDKLIAEEEKK